jgi:hypothetical protein
MIAPRTPILSPELKQRVDSELRSGERLIWAAQPLARAFRRQGCALQVFAIPWTAFSIFWVVSAAWMTSNGNAPGPFSLFPLFGVPFVLIGFGMLTAPYWFGRRAVRTLYAVTDRRAIIFASGVFGGQTVQSFMPERLTSIARNERADGTGDLVFERFTTAHGSGSRTVTHGFMGIDRVREVEDLLYATLLKDRVGGAR